MKIELSPLLNSASGKIGNIVIQRNAHGAMARALVIPASNKTSKKALSNSTFVTIANKWATLSSTEKQSFINKRTQYVFTDRFGNTYNPTAYQLFMFINAVLYNQTLIFITTCPDYVPVATPIGSIVITNSGADSITLSLTDYPTSNPYIQIFASPPVPILNKLSNSSLRALNGFFYGGSGTVQLYSSYVNIFPVNLSKSFSINWKLYYIDPITQIPSAPLLLQATFEP